MCNERITIFFRTWWLVDFSAMLVSTGPTVFLIFIFTATKTNTPTGSYLTISRIWGRNRVSGLKITALYGSVNNVQLECHMEGTLKDISIVPSTEYSPNAEQVFGVSSATSDIRQNSTDSIWRAPSIWLVLSRKSSYLLHFFLFFFYLLQFTLVMLVLFLTSVSLLISELLIVLCLLWYCI